MAEQPNEAARPDRSQAVVIVGGGVMGGAIASGLVADGWTNVTVIEPTETRRAELADEFGLKAVAGADEIAESPDVVAIVVKPKVAPSVCEQVTPLIADRTLVMSMCAGVTLGELEANLPDAVPLVRVMPNTPAQVGKGMSALSPNPHVSDEQLALADALMQAVGETMVVPESLQDAVTGVSGSGPAYVFYLAEALIEAGVQVGLTRAQADKLARQTIIGSAQLLASGEHPTILRERVTSPGGTTAAAIRELDAHATRAAVSDAVWAAYRRSRGE